MGDVDALGWQGHVIDDRYRVETLIGEGGQGLVYRGVHLGFDEPIAIKCLKLPSTLDAIQRDQLLQSFRAEARLLHRLSRRTAGIVQALDIGAASSPSGVWSPYIVMEWLEGETLHDRLEGQGALGLDEAVALLAPAAEALAVAHRSGVCHLDVKPGNLLVCRQDEGPRPTETLKVLDFGIAKVLTDAAVSAPADGGHRLFTPAYGAPEQFSPRHGARGPWTDVFALALVLVELVAGRRALGDGDASQLYVASADEQRRPGPQALGAVVTAAVDHVLVRALAVDPAERYRTLGDLWGALERAVAAGSSVATGPASPITGDMTPPSPLWPVASAPTVPVVPAPAGDNRVCTILSIGLCGLEALHDELEPEAVQEVADGCLGFVQDGVESLGGRVDQVVDSSVVAIFGLHHASDNDAERALHAALNIRRTLDGYALPHRALEGFRVRAAIGIATGRVFTGGGERARRLSVTGRAVTVASALRHEAGAGQLLIDRDTHRLVAGLFEVQRGTPLELPNQREPVARYLVQGVAPARRALTAVDFYGVETKLVGRAAEMQRLEELVEASLGEPAARIATLVGPAGVGRSRLLTELAGRLEGRARVWTMQGSALETHRGHGKLAELLRTSFHIHEDDPPEVVQSKLRQRTRELRRRRLGDPYAPLLSTLATRASERDPSTDEIVEVLGQVLGASAPTPGGALADDAGQRAKGRVAGAMAAVLRSIDAPIVLICDDIQWVDHATLDLIDDLAVRMSDAPLLILCSARPSLFERRPHWGEGRDAHVRVEVRPMPKQQLEAMLRDRLQRAEGLTGEVVGRLAERAEGSPLALVEGLHLLVDAGAVEVHAEGPWVVHPDRIGELSLPATVQGLIQARLDRLAAGERELIGHAAVVGRVFWDGAVAAVGQAAAAPLSATTPLGREAVAATLNALRDKGLIRMRDGSTFPDERELVFTESAVHEVAYEMLSARVRRRIHEEIARWLERRSGPEGATSVAHHFERAGDLRRAAAAYLAAARHAAGLGQNHEALHSLDRAALIEEGTFARESVAERGRDRRVLSWQDRVQLRLDRGDVLRRLGRLDEAEQSYSLAGERIVESEQRTGEAPALAERGRRAALVDHRLALVKQQRGRLDEARDLVTRAIEGAMAAGAEEEAPMMWALLAAVESRLDRLDACRAASLRGLSTCRRLPRGASYRASVSELLITLGGAFFKRRSWVRAERCYLQASRVVDMRSEPYQASRALNNVAVVRYQRGDLDGTRQVLRRVLELNERVGDLAMLMTALSNVAELEHRLGNSETARRCAKQAAHLGEQLRAEADLPEIYRNLAEASAALGENDEALEAATRALGLAAKEAARVYLPGVAATAARLCRAVPDHPGAAALEATLRDAVAVLAPEEAARCLAALGSDGG